MVRANQKSGIALIIVGMVIGLAALKLAVSGHADSVTLFVLSALFLLAGAAVLTIDQGKRTPKEKESDTRASAALDGDLIKKMNMGDSRRPDTPLNHGNKEKGTEKTHDKETLDEIYAAKHDRWVCPYCEALNPKENLQCVSCGKKR